MHSQGIQGGGEGAKSRDNLLVHFVQLHVRYTIAIMLEVNIPHPLCPNCDMFVPWTVLNIWNSAITLYMCEAEWKGRRRTYQEVQ